MSNKVVLGLGGNVGNVQNTLTKCIDLLSCKLGEVQLKSSLYKTKAWGVENQPDFINQVIEIETDLSPTECLTVCQNIEQELGRVRQAKWHQRTIDIDVLFFNDEIINTPDLKIPHPFIQDRNFVLFPLAEILPNYRHPKLKKTILELKNSCSDNLEAIKI